MNDFKTNKEGGKDSNLAEFCRKIAKQKDCPPEFVEIVNKEFWNLI